MRGRHLAVLLVIAVLYGCAGQDAAVEDGTIDLARGQDLYARNCAACHGPAGEGAATGPPLVDEVYVPSHHADESFQVAVARGVQAHHWDFGDMPPIPALDRDQVADITAHVRELQAAAGLLDEDA